MKNHIVEIEIDSEVEADLARLPAEIREALVSQFRSMKGKQWATECRQEAFLATDGGRVYGLRAAVDGPWAGDTGDGFLLYAVAVLGLDSK